MEFPELETNRLILREIKEDDAEDLFKNFSDDRVMQHYGSEKMTQIEETVGLIHSFKMNYIENKGFRWGIQIKGQNRLIGTVGFHAWSSKNRRAEIGYELHPDYWGKGYAQESISRALEFGLNEMDLMRIGAVVFLENGQSNELLVKLGFQKEGVLKNYIIQNGVSYDTNIYSKVKG
ncbi:MAG: GNAT family protein [Mesobacillus sp.]|uniref:GNAT family N-acetyltransferase n=1 Tax=Mesobacillus sp. TaxID=2675271 RepID=UPI003C5963E6